MVATQHPFYGLSELLVAGWKVGNKRYSTNPHHEIGRKRRLDVSGLYVRENAHGNQVRSMQMDFRACVVALAVHAEVKKRVVRRWIAIDEPSIRVEVRNVVGSSEPKDAFVGFMR